MVENNSIVYCRNGSYKLFMNYSFQMSGSEKLVEVLPDSRMREHPETIASQVQPYHIAIFFVGSTTSTSIPSVQQRFSG